MRSLPPPPRVFAFASGVNEAREIRGFSLARTPVGFSAGHVREKAKEELLRSGLPLFADSGAFSEVAATPQGLTVTRPISHTDWMRRLSLYQCRADRHGSRLSLAVPDRVGDQEYTLGLLERYRAEVQRVATTGARLLVPLQRGDLTPEDFYERACEQVGVPLHPAFPMKKAGMCQEQILRSGYQRASAKRLVRRLLTAFSEITISLDSNHRRAVTGQARPLTRAEAAMHASEAKGLFACADHPALRRAEEPAGLHGGDCGSFDLGGAIGTRTYRGRGHCVRDRPATVPSRAPCLPAGARRRASAMGLPSSRRRS